MQARIERIQQCQDTFDVQLMQ